MGSLAPREIAFGQVFVQGRPEPQELVFEASAEHGTYTTQLWGDDAARFTLSAGLSARAMTAAAQATVFVHYLADEAGAHEAEVVVLDADDQVVARSRISGETAVPSGPWIDGGRTALGFGSVEVGSSSLGAVTIGSDDDGASYSYACSLATGGPFSLARSSATAAGGVTVSLQIAFAPSAETAYADTLTIEWSRTEGEPSSGALVLDLAGDGVVYDEDDDEAAEEDVASMDQNRQRATFAVPSHATVVNLGAAWVTDLEQRTQSGFSAATTRNVWLEAAKTVTMQAEGHAWFQSTDDSTYVMSGKRSYFVAGQSAYVGGGIYLGLMAGYGSETGRGLGLDDDGNPDTPSTASDVNVGFFAADVLWRVAGLLTSTWGLAKAVFDVRCLDDPDAKFLQKMIPTGAIKAAYGVSAMATYLVASTLMYAYGRATGSDLQSVSLYSEAGLNAGSPAFTTISGTIGTSVLGLNVSLMGFAHLSLEGGISATMETFGDASILAGGDASLVTGMGRCSIASRAGATSLTGATMKIGGIVPGPYVVGPTRLLWMDAVSKIAFDAMGPAATGVSFDGLDATLASTLGEASFVSAESTLLGSEVAYRIEATPAGIVISSPTGPVVQVRPGTIILGPAAGPLTMGAGVTDIGVGAISITPAMAICNAPAVDLL